MRRLRMSLGWSRYLLVWPAVQSYRRRARRSLRWRLAGYNLATLIAGLATALILVGLLAAAGAAARNYAREEPADDARSVARFLLSTGLIRSGEATDATTLTTVLTSLSGGQAPLYRDPARSQFDVRPKQYLKGVQGIAYLGSADHSVVSSPGYTGAGSGLVAAIAGAWAGGTDLRRNSSFVDVGDAEAVGAYPVFADDGSVTGVVVVEKTEIQAPEGLGVLRAEIRPVIGSVWVGSVVAAIPGLAVAAILAIAAARSVGGRVRELSVAAESLAGGAFESRVVVRGEDEIASLGESFNTMAEQLETTMGSLTTERERAVSLLDANRQLVADVSHELRTPVALIRGQLEALDEEFPGNQRATMAIREVGRLEQLVSDLFALAAAEAQTREPEQQTFDCLALLRDVTGALAELAKREAGITLVCDVPDAELIVRGNAQRLGGVVQNLLRNAVRHTPEGGLIRLRATRDVAGVLIEVSDTGTGINPEDLPHVFERFYRGDSSRSRETGGTGLGLALAKEFVEGMGGSITVASPPGEGATFAVQLPAV